MGDVGRFLGLLLCAGAIVSVLGGPEHIQMHSCFPPILSDFWENGLHFWSFGSSTIITDDYVRLTTTAPEAKGYFWNRHPNHIESFIANTTVRLRKRKSGWFADSTDGGVAMWYTAAAPRHVQTTLFGSADEFDGVGVVLDHSDQLSVLFSDGAERVGSLRSAARGHCQVSGLSDKKVTLTMLYNAEAKTLRVLYHLWEDETAPGPDVMCTEVEDVVLPIRNYFGITASNSLHAQAEHDMVSFFVKPLRKLDGTADEEEELSGLHLFDMARERKLQAEWHGRADKPLSSERSVDESSNEPEVKTSD